MKLPLVGQSYSLASLTSAAQESLNVYAEVIEDPNEKGKNIAILRGCPGFHKLTTLPTPKIRGLWSGGGRLFVVSGSHLYEVGQGSYPGTPGGGTVISNRDLGANDTFPAQMFGNGNQLGIVANGQFYVDNGAGPVAARFQLNGKFTTADGTHLVWSSGDQFTASMVGRAGTFNGSPIVVDVYTDATHITIHSTVGIQLAAKDYSIDGGSLVTAVTGGYTGSSFYVQRPSGGTPDLGRQVNYSAVNDGTRWNGLDFFIKEGYPDYLNSILCDPETIYLLGTESAEVWKLDPNTGRPVRLPGTAIRQGSTARWAPVSMGGIVCFLGGSSQGQTIAFRLGSGLQPIRISTHAVEQAWAATGAFAAEATSYAYIEGGHQFWVINFAGQAKTWVYDVTASQQFGTPIWHQRAHWNSGGSSFDPYKLWFHTFIPEWGAHGMHIVGDYNSGDLYELSSDFFDQDGSDLAWRRALPYVYNAGNRVFFGRLTLELETGTVASGAAPVITLDYSDDRGHNFTNPRNASIGAHNDYSLRVYWLRNGSSRGRVLRLFGKGQSKMTLIDLQCEETGGTA